MYRPSANKHDMPVTVRFERACRRRQQSSPSAALALPRGMSLIRAHDRRLLWLLGLEDVHALRRSCV